MRDLLPCAVDDETGKFSSDPKLTFQHPYPPTKIMFIPDKEGSSPDLLATTGDFLRIWRVSEDSVQLHKLLNNVHPTNLSTCPTVNMPHLASFPARPARQLFGSCYLWLHASDARRLSWLQCFQVDSLTVMLRPVP